MVPSGHPLPPHSVRFSCPPCTLGPISHPSCSAKLHAACLPDKCVRRLFHCDIVPCFLPRDTMHIRTCSPPICCRGVDAFGRRMGAVAGRRPSHHFQHALVRCCAFSLRCTRGCSCQRLAEGCACAISGVLVENRGWCIRCCRGSAMINTYELLKRICALPEEAEQSS